MSIFDVKRKTQERARQIDSDRDKVLNQLFHARKEVKELELLAAKMGKEHLDEVEKVMKIDRLAIHQKKPESIKNGKEIRSYILKAFNHLEINPFEIPDFFNVRTAIMWWISRERKDVSKKDLFLSWTQVVGEQETSLSTPVSQIIRHANESKNPRLKKLKEKLSKRVLLDPAPELQESKEPGQDQS